MEEEAAKSSNSPSMQPSTSGNINPASSAEGTPGGPSDEAAADRGENTTEDSKTAGRMYLLYIYKACKAANMLAINRALL